MTGRLRWLAAGLRDLALAACFLGALSLEAPGSERLATLAVLFALLLGWVHLRDVPRIAGHRLVYLTYAVDLALVFLIEQHSRFIINYYFHAFYLVLIVTAGLSLPRRPGLWVMGAAFLVSTVKFVELAAVTGMPANLSLGVFSALTTVLVMAVITYARHLQDERETTARLYAELQRYARRVEELSVAAERNRLAREIHDTVGHSLTGLIMELEMCRRVLDQDTAKAAAMLEAIQEHVRDGLVGVRRAVDALRPRELEQSPLEAALRRLIDEYSRNGALRIELAVPNPFPRLSPVAELGLFRAVQEALTNAVRHGQADRIAVVLDAATGLLALRVTDNGRGCPAVVPGNGLTGMRERLAGVGGWVSWESPVEGSFTVKVQIPVDGTAGPGGAGFSGGAVAGRDVEA